MSVLDKAESAVNGTGGTWQTVTASDSERVAHWTAEVRKAEQAHATAQPFDRWNTLRALVAAQEQLAAVTRSHPTEAR